MKSEQCRFCRNVLLLLFGALSVSLFSANSMGQSLTPRSIAFDGAEGFGKFSRGGAEGKLYIVTSLEDKDEPGTLRYAINQKHPRVITFAVSGVIKLSKELKVNHGRITLAGQTSAGGITISGAPFTVSNAEDVIIRFIRFRLGTFKVVEDALTVRNSNNVIIDHCSLSWSVDETGSFYNNRNFTLQNSIISYSLNDSIHPKGKHGYGGIWGGANASFINNIIANHASRTPRINGHRLKSPYPYTDEFIEVSNNIIFNWGHNNVYGSENGRFNLIANYYKPGKASKRIQFADIWFSPFISKNQAYIAGNILEGYPEFDDKNWLAVNYRNKKEGKRIASQANSPWLSDKKIIVEKESDFKAKNAKQVFYDIAQNQLAGANRNANGVFIDSVDQLVYDQLNDKRPVTGDGLINHELDVIPSWQAYEAQFKDVAVVQDKNNDGIADSWFAQQEAVLKTLNESQKLELYLEHLAK